MKIGPYNIEEEVFIVAEIGNNHEGDFGLAKELIGLASDAGVQAVKFQTIIPDKLVSVAEKKRIEQLSRYQFSDDQFSELRDIAESHELVFLSTPFSLDAVPLLDRLAPAFKIASGDNNFFPLIEEVCKTGKPILISTGLATFEEIKATKAFVDESWSRNKISPAGLVLLHCVCSYPTQPRFANLKAISELALLDCYVGYSDHTLGNEAAVLSVALGARVIEKHFTIDHNHSDFRDHQLSADPVELTELVSRVREAEVLLGEGDAGVLGCEEGNLIPVRRSIVASKNLQQGRVLEMDDLSWVRPGSGLAPGREPELLGKKLTRDVEAGAQLSISDVVSEIG